MSKTTKRKHVTKEVLEDYYIPEDEEEIVKIIRGRGNNLHEVENGSGNQFLVSMPTKFRKNVWVKRGDYVIMVPIKEGNKVQGEIVYILYPKQIKYLKDENLWPKEFDVSLPAKDDSVKPESEDKTENSQSDTSGDDLFENPNHRHTCYYSDDYDSDDSSAEEDGSSDDEDFERSKTNET